jgi:starvation-inducible DNA-binding protein
MAKATLTRSDKHSGAKPEKMVTFKKLATPTILPLEDVQEITMALNPLVADALTLYVKTKNYHWHLSGPHFRDYHLLFDEQAAAILDTVDVLAERVRRIGGTTIRSIGHIFQLQTILDDNEEYVPANEMLRHLMEDNKQIVQALQTAHAVCERCADVATVNELETIIDATEHRIWFLFEMLQEA